MIGVCAGSCILVAVPALALTLTQAISLARQGDPAYLTAHANVLAARGRADQAFGATLPQLSASLSTNGNRRAYETLDSPIPPANDGYNSNSATINLTFPLYRRAGAIAVNQSETAYLQMREQLAAAEQDLFVRLAQAWFDWMLARDMLLCAEGQSLAMRNQSEQYAYAVKVGLVAGPVAEEARSKYDQALAEQLVAESEQHVKLAALEQVIGVQPSIRPPALADSYLFDSARLELSERLWPDAQRAQRQQNSLAQWLARAEAQSPMILAAKRGLEAAEDEISKQRAGHHPTADLVGSYGKNGQRAGSFPGQNGYDIKQRVIGIQINIPLLAGGSVGAKVDEAVALREKARQELELARRNVRMAGKQAWFGFQSGEARRTASEQAVKFARVSLLSAEAGKRNDLNSALDVLQVRQQLLNSLRDVQRARYETITSHFKLLASIGRLRAADLAALDAVLTDKPEDASLLREARLAPLVPSP